jgi:hypothetical protein
MKLYLLYYDIDYGNREAWNTFYTPVEVFDSAEKRQARIDFIQKQVDDTNLLLIQKQVGEPVEYEFHEVDTVLMTDALAQEWKHD